MPIQFFTNAERERLNRFPTEIQYQDLVTFFTPSEADKAQIPVYSAIYNRLGFALQLCTLRFMGFVPDDLQSIPPAVIEYVARQLDTVPDDLTEYGTRDQTRTEHLQKIMDYLGYRKINSNDLGMLSSWLTERAHEHDKASLLYELICGKLRSEKILRPGVTSLERLIAEARKKAQAETMQRLSPLLSESCKAFLDSFVISSYSRDGSFRVITPLTWLRQSASSNSPHAILNNLEKIIFLEELGAPGWELESIINPNRLKRLAQIARKSTAQGLQRSVEERRYPVLMAFLYQSLVDITDETMDMFDRCLAETDARARGDLGKYRKSVARATNEKVRLFTDIGHLVLDEEILDTELRRAILEYIPKETLRNAVEESERIVRPLDDNSFDFLDKRYSYLRQLPTSVLIAISK